MASVRQTPLTCSGHTRPVVHLSFSDITESGYYLISACKGNVKHFPVQIDSCSCLTLSWYLFLLNHSILDHLGPLPFHSLKALQFRGYRHRVVLTTRDLFLPVACCFALSMWDERDMYLKRSHWIIVPCWYIFQI